jgi:hypothetical protein
MTASMDFCVGFTPDDTHPYGKRPAERGEYEISNLEGIAVLAWDEDRPKAVELHPLGYRIAEPRTKHLMLTGPEADMALERINQDQHELMKAWRESLSGEEADYRYEAAE